MINYSYTSRLNKSLLIEQGAEKNRGGIRDISSARKIAFRKGKIWNSAK